MTETPRRKRPAPSTRRDTKPVMFHLPEEEHLAVRVAAAKAGLPIAHWVRQVVREAAKEVGP